MLGCVQRGFIAFACKFCRSAVTPPPWIPIGRMLRSHTSAAGAQRHATPTLHQGVPCMALSAHPAAHQHLIGRSINSSCSCSANVTHAVTTSSRSRRLLSFSSSTAQRRSLHTSTVAAAAAASTTSSAPTAAGATPEPAPRPYDNVRRELTEDEMKARPEEVAHWKRVIDKCTRRVSIEASTRLDWEWRLGVRPYWHKDNPKPNCFDYMMRGKVKHPYALTLVRVGSFYEAAGMDALLLVEHTGVAFMGGGGGGGGTLKAGCPVVNLQPTLKSLVRDNGFEVVIYEEVADNPNGTKERQMVQLVTPENPQYMYKFAECMVDVDVDAASICGLAVTTRGLTVYVYSYASNSIIVHEGLTADGAWGVINAEQGGKPVVYLHWPHDLRKRATVNPLYRDIAALQRAQEDAVTWRNYSTTGSLDGFKARLLMALNQPADTHLTIKRRDWSSGTNAVRPLYESTAAQLGLTRRVVGVPNIVDAMVTSPAVRDLVRDILTGLLMSPPPHTVAASTRQAVRLLMGYSDSLPEFSVRGTTPKKVLLLLRAQEGNAGFFQSLLADLVPVIQALTADPSSKLASLVDAVWPLLLHTTDNTPTTLTKQQVLDAARYASQQISQLVAPADGIAGRQRRSSSSSVGDDSGAGGGGSSLSSDDDADAQMPVKATTGVKRRRAVSSTPASYGFNPPPFDKLRDDANAAYEALAASVETWDKRVAPTAITNELWQMVEAAQHLTAVLQSLLQASCGVACKKVEMNKRNTPLVWVDNSLESIRLKLPSATTRQALANTPLHLRTSFNSPSGETVQVDAPNQVLRVPPAEKRGAKGRAAEGTFTCEALDAALADYLAAARLANEASTAVLKTLAADLSEHTEALAAAMQLGILLTTLLEHARAAVKAGWSVPLVGSREQQQQRGAESAASEASSSSSNGGSSSSVSSRPEHDGVLQLRGLWPYWKSVNDPTTVVNDVELQGFMLLTGPNMAGKSTVLRSVAAAALAGSVGLAIPAAPGSKLPRLDGVMLRTFSGDAPQEGLSAYGVEMKEMTTVLGDARPSSLVLIDELGKGTEVVSGTALAGGILNTLADRGAMGIFATHLHLLVDLLEHIPNIQLYKMEIVTDDSSSQQQQRRRPLLNNTIEEAAAGGAGGLDTAAAAASTAPAWQPDESSSYLYAQRPTWRLLPGTCFESLAFSVARDCGLPPRALEAAQTFYHHITGGSSSGSSGDGSSSRRGGLSARAYEKIIAVKRASSSPGSSSSSSSSPTASVGGSSGSSSWVGSVEEVEGDSASDGGGSSSSGDEEEGEGEGEGEAGVTFTAAGAVAGQQQQQTAAPAVGDVFSKGSRNSKLFQTLRSRDESTAAVAAAALAAADSAAAAASQPTAAGQHAVRLQSVRETVAALFEQFRPQLVGPSAAAAAGGAGIGVTAAATARELEAAAAADTSLNNSSSGSSGDEEQQQPTASPRSRRRRRSTGKQRQPQQEQGQDEQGSSLLTAGAILSSTSSSGSTAQQQQQQGQEQTFGVVCELAPSSQPPPDHEGQPVIYLLHEPTSGWSYIGESQELRTRLRTHRSKFGAGLTLWYCLVGPGVDRKVVQGRLIRAAEQAGLLLSSNRDASMARGK